MTSKDRTDIITSKIGNRRLKLSFPEYGLTGRMVLKILFPSDIDPYMNKSSLEKEVLLYTKEIKDEIEPKIKSLIKKKFEEIEEGFSESIFTDIKNNKLWEFRLNFLANKFDTVNYKSQISDCFSQLKRNIISEKKKLEGKKLIMDWVDNNPYLSTFPLARNTSREFVFHMGPTNSGKTYTAIQDLKKAESGCYLAPLRLLAHEIYDDLNKDGIYCSLVTGEEKIEVPSATVVASTIEMANFNKMYDVAIIDEIQMITDPLRGWAWVQAVCGIPASKIYLAGSEEALPFVKKLVEEILNEKLTIERFERKNELEVESSIFNMEDDEIKEGDAFVVFSRKKVFEIKEYLNDKCSIIYGSLSPEVRKSEARKFREGENKVIVSTDAIGMGLNLPIARIIFVDDMKFNGKETVRPDSQLVKQISGRAGRYGKFEKGYVTSIDEGMRKYISSCLDEHNVYDATNYKFQVSPNVNLIKEVANSIGTTNLYSVLVELREIFLLDPQFTLMDITQMIDVSGIVNTSLSLDIKYVYSCSPINLKMDRDKEVFRNWSNFHKSGTPIKLSNIPDVRIRNDKTIQDTLWFLENHIKLLSCYMWLSNRFPEIYVDAENVSKKIDLLNNKIIDILDKK